MSDCWEEENCKSIVRVGDRGVKSKGGGEREKSYTCGAVGDMIEK